MSKIRVEMNRDGMNELLHSDGLRSALAEYGEQVRSRCTAGHVGTDEYGCSVKNAGSRLVARVYPKTPHARNSNMAHNTLLKALNGGG